MKNQGVGKNYPLHHQHERGECGGRGTCPGGQPSLRSCTQWQRRGSWVRVVPLLVPRLLQTIL